MRPLNSWLNSQKPFKAVFFKNSTRGKWDFDEKIYRYRHQIRYRYRYLKHYFFTDNEESEYAEAVLDTPMMDISPIRICSDNPTIESQAVMALEWGRHWGQHWESWRGNYTYLIKFKLAVSQLTENKTFLKTRNFVPNGNPNFCAGMNGGPLLAGLTLEKYCLVGTAPG